MSNHHIKERTFETFDPLFDNSYEKVGPEFGLEDQKKQEFLEANAGKYVLKPEIPLDIPGLIRRSATQRRIPATQRWFRRTSSFERNGIFNIQTPTMNVRVLSWCFFLFIGYGWMGFQTSSWNSVVKNDSQEIRGTPYDKLSMRELPPTKMWTRPG